MGKQRCGTAQLREPPRRGLLGHLYQLFNLHVLCLSNLTFRHLSYQSQNAKIQVHRYSSNILCMSKRPETKQVLNKRVTVKSWLMVKAAIQEMNCTDKVHYHIVLINMPKIYGKWKKHDPGESRSAHKPIKQCTNIFLSLHIKSQEKHTNIISNHCGGTYFSVNIFLFFLLFFFNECYYIWSFVLLGRTVARATTDPMPPNWWKNIGFNEAPNAVPIISPATNEAPSLVTFCSKHLSFPFSVTHGETATHMTTRQGPMLPPDC